MLSWQIIGQACTLLHQCICIKHTKTVADPGGDPHGAKEPPFGLDLVLRSTDDRLNETTLSG